MKILLPLFSPRKLDEDEWEIILPRRSDEDEE